MDYNPTEGDNLRFIDMIAYLSIYGFDEEAVCDIETLHTYLLEDLRVPRLNINKLDYIVRKSDDYRQYFDTSKLSNIKLTKRGKDQLQIQRDRDEDQLVSIYQIYHDGEERSYIGQARDPEKRWQQHLALLREEKHHNHELQFDFIFYLREKSICFNILEDNIPLYLACNYEYYYCRLFDEEETPIYNVAPIELKLNTFAGQKLIRY